jgi:hypothetical protein
MSVKDMPCPEQNLIIYHQGERHSPLQKNMAHETAVAVNPKSAI